MGTTSAKVCSKPFRVWHLLIWGRTKDDIATPEGRVAAFDRTISTTGAARRQVTIVGTSVIIDVVSVKFDRQVLSINSRGQATGYILTYQVFFRFVDRTGRVLANPARLKLSRTLEYQSKQVLPKKQEEDALRARMREDLVQQILRRLNSVSQLPRGSLKIEQYS